jgi:Holliday junction DNA helicase RuvA
MISFLVGELATVQSGRGQGSTDGHRSSMTVNVNGVGYRLLVPQRWLHELPAIGEVMQVFTHLCIRDTEMVLYGFGSAAERDVFVELIKVSGVGPSLGLALLNTLSLQELVQAVVAENVRILSLTPGVGKKTAQRLILELKSKLEVWRQEAIPDGVRSGGVPNAIYAEVEMALLALGYGPSETARALQLVGREGNTQVGSTIEEWLRSAIAYLSQQG